MTRADPSVGQLSGVGGEGRRLYPRDEDDTEASCCSAVHLTPDEGVVSVNQSGAALLEGRQAACGMMLLAYRDSWTRRRSWARWYLSLIHISEPTRLGMISY